MKTRELERLNDLLLKLHEASIGDGELRDEISRIRHAIHEIIDEREAVNP